jgi:predicted HNH restriction endonuclease
LDVHHIIPFRKFGIDRYREANKISNLISLCNSCHSKFR